MDFLQEYVGMEGFGDIVGCARLHGEYGVLHLCITGHDDEGHVELLPGSPAQYLKTVVVGESEVGEYQVGVPVVLEVSQCRTDGGHPVGAEPFFLQPCLYHGSESQVILYNQYVRHFCQFLFFHYYFSTAKIVELYGSSLVFSHFLASKYH